MTDETTTTEETAAPTITRGEARELKSLVKGEFAVLKGELDGRVQTLQAQIRERGGELRKNAYQRDVVPLVNRLEKELDRVAKLANELADELERKGYKNKWGKSKLSFDNPLERFEPSDIDVDKAITTLMREYNRVVNQMDRMQQDYVRQLTLESITTEAAREFILNFPTAEDLLQLPEAATNILEA